MLTIPSIFISITLAYGQLSPDARTPRAAGVNIVNSISDDLNQIFPYDYGFMKRVACTESNYGRHNDTYRVGYYGGIWQVDRSGFEDTQDVAAHPKLGEKYKLIMSRYGIHWESVDYVDLLKPLYSGIAARLFISSIPEQIPEKQCAQANYWKRHYNTNEGAGSPQNFCLDLQRGYEGRRIVGDCPICACSKFETA